jgi:hypothetical protein
VSHSPNSTFLPQFLISLTYISVLVNRFLKSLLGNGRVNSGGIDVSEFNRYFLMLFRFKFAQNDCVVSRVY